MIKTTRHRLDGIEPDIVLALLALFGLLRALERSRPEWRPRAAWTVDELPVRGTLHLRTAVSSDEVSRASVAGVAELAQHHRFPFRNLKDLHEDQARAELREAAIADPYRADLWAALVSDKAHKSREANVEPTPMCLQFGQGHQHFLSRLRDLPDLARSDRERARDAVHEALFAPWDRADRTDGFRWDPAEDVRHAYRFDDPTKSATKQGTQHGANILAAVGLATLMVAPHRRGPDIRLDVRGGRRERRFSLQWPIWAYPASLERICGMLDHPELHRMETRAMLGITEVFRSRQISVGKLLNMTRAKPVAPRDRPRQQPTDRGSERRIGFRPEPVRYRAGRITS